MDVQGSESRRARRDARTVVRRPAVQRTAAELRPGDDGKGADLALVVSEVRGERAAYRVISASGDGPELLPVAGGLPNLQPCALASRVRVIEHDRYPSLGRGVHGL